MDQRVRCQCHKELPPSAKATSVSLVFSSHHKGTASGGSAPRLSARRRVMLWSPGPEDRSPSDTRLYRLLYSIDDIDSDKTSGSWGFASNLSCSLAHTCLCPIHPAPGTTPSPLLLCFTQVGS